MTSRPGGEPPAPVPTAPETPVRRQRLSVRALLRRDDDVLLARIAATGFAGGGAWTLPGGGVDHGEHPEASLVREVYEETGLDLVVGPVLGVFSRHFTGRAPSGRLEDFHGVHLIYTGHVRDPLLEPHVTEIDGTTDAVGWVPVPDVLDGRIRTSEVVRYALGVAAARLV